MKIIESESESKKTSSKNEIIDVTSDSSEIAY